MFDKSNDPLEIAKQIHKTNKELASEIAQNEGDEAQSDKKEKNEQTLKKESKISFKKIKFEKDTIKAIVLAVFLIMLTCAFEFAVLYYKDCISPYKTDALFGDTRAYFNTSYNPKYKIARLDLKIDETVEKWQTEILGDVLNEIKVTCEVKDENIKKEYIFKDVELKTGELIKSSITMEDISLNDYLLLKDSLKLGANITIWTPVAKNTMTTLCKTKIGILCLV